MHSSSIITWLIFANHRLKIRRMILYEHTYMYLVIVTVRDCHHGFYFVVMQVARFRISDVEAGTVGITSTGK